MSEEQLKDIINKYPDYTDIFKEVAKLLENDILNEFRASVLYSRKFDFPHEKIDMALYYLEKEGYVSAVYRIMDEDGVSIGKDFNDIMEIPETLDTPDGYRIKTADEQIVPFYHKIPSI